MSISHVGKTAEVFPHADKASLASQNDPEGNIYPCITPHTSVFIKSLSTCNKYTGYFTENLLRVGIY